MLRKRNMNRIIMPFAMGLYRQLKPVSLLCIQLNGGPNTAAGKRRGEQGENSGTAVLFGGAVLKV
jgi:hypothetical protein